MIYDNWENLTKYSALMPDAIAAIEKFMATVSAETPSVPILCSATMSRHRFLTRNQSSRKGSL